MRYLVTGGAGFIGSHLVQSLVEDGHFVRIIDDFSTGTLDNLKPIIGHHLLEIINGDIRDLSLVLRHAAGMDGIFHQAALVSVPKSIEHPGLSFDINVRGTLAVLEAARLTSAKRVVLASSAAVYGNISSFPLRETVNIIPHSPYALDKYVLEQYAEQYHRLYEIKPIILRYFNVYGARQSSNSSYSGVITRFIDNICGGDSVTVFGDGNQSRDFVHVLDVVKANILAMKSMHIKFNIYNIGSGYETTINNIIDVLKKITGRHFQVCYVPHRSGDIRRSCADIKRACSELGYYPKWELNSGIHSIMQVRI